MSDWHDYNNSLAYEPQGDWSETQPKSCTDRTPQVLQLIDRVAKLESENKKLKMLLEYYFGDLQEHFKKGVEDDSI